MSCLRKISVHVFRSIVSGSDEGPFQRLSPLLEYKQSQKSLICMRKVLGLTRRPLDNVFLTWFILFRGNDCWSFNGRGLPDTLRLEEHRRSYNNYGQDRCADTFDVSDSRRNGGSWHFLCPYVWNWGIPIETFLLEARPPWMKIKSVVYTDRTDGRQVHTTEVVPVLHRFVSSYGAVHYVEPQQPTSTREDGLSGQRRKRRVKTEE